MPVKKRRRCENGKFKSKSQSSSDNEHFEVDRIENHKIVKNNSIEFHVKWKGYPSTDNTWETFERFAHDAPGIAQDYLSRVLKDPKKHKESH